MSSTKTFKIQLGTFDLIKGLALFSVILGHALPHYDMEQLAWVSILTAPLTLFKNTANPLFFIISGFSFKEKPVKKFFEKTCAELIKPYAYVTLLVAVLFPLMHYLSFRWWPGAIEEAIRTVLAFLLGTPHAGKVVFGYGLYENSVVWFLLSLFISLNVLNLIFQNAKEEVRAVLVACCVGLGYLLLQLDFYYFCLPQGLLAVGYCYIGSLLKKYNFFNCKSRNWIYAIFAVITAWQLVFGDCSIAHGVFKYGLLDYAASICGGILAMAVGIQMGRSEWKCLEWVKKVGVYSYWIICIHSVEMTCIRWYLLTEHFANQQIVALLIETCLKVAIFVSGCFVLKQMVKNKYRRKLQSHGK